MSYLDCIQSSPTTQSDQSPRAIHGALLLQLKRYDTVYSFGLLNAFVTFRHSWQPAVHSVDRETLVVVQIPSFRGAQTQASSSCRATSPGGRTWLGVWPPLSLIIREDIEFFQARIDWITVSHVWAMQMCTWFWPYID
ncbi:hypothetical protein HBH56_169530 [Parastagonospora nodorum]|uniref:Uncharacterized protein n=1 Tax=Phaeosphaeria nodorum (strain SN15 / ATCC MYA-4574 / FGSC 10173) TaxID=321614 RepID=A0A7U2F0E3_PHANO|nr:hypothetical protein HBH56_169530 [Parastagonospora nodorum]QRC94370.1 hypothetical protein JI435_430650 [Parastagonospora nodorum SN15]KAH3928303.1 hypothetical protein HBH54_138080 [Parastagonospora nodorum]KAH3945371.1 hypothetical protein HBH53_143430 [Parastagonospora nodorum]KAH3985407.1 hypothetical protein HBH51_019620 [Parastagonospora nodorum]